MKHAPNRQDILPEGPGSALAQLAPRQLEVRRLEPFEAAVRDLEIRLQETEQSRSGPVAGPTGADTGGSRGHRWERFI